MNAPNRLFVMNAYLTAIEGKITKRYKRGSIRNLKGGFIPNPVWNDVYTVGSDRRARELHNDPEYSYLFETIKRKEFMKRYYPVLSNQVKSNYEYTRIKPSERLIWELIVRNAISKWENNHGKIEW